MYIAIAFLSGGIIAWLLRSISLSSAIKKNMQLNEQRAEDKLLMEKLQTEHSALQHEKIHDLESFSKRYKELESVNASLQHQVAILTNKFDESDALLKAGQPVIHSLKLKLIEANNTIARYKGRMPENNK
ncbi:MAG: hypothetical protein ABIN92_01055 [Ferruginibacter sp.]